MFMSAKYVTQGFMPSDVWKAYIKHVTEMVTITAINRPVLAGIPHYLLMSQSQSMKFKFLQVKV
jgi:hypothetical protein